MIKKIAGYLLAAIGFLGYGYLRNYKGDIIPYPTFWFFVSIAIGIIGLVMIVSTSLRPRRNRAQERFDKERLDRLRQQGEKIILTSNNCEIRETEEEPEANSSIVYYHTIGNIKHRFTSTELHFTEAILRKYIQERRVVLYINRNNPNDYEFEIAE